LPTQFQKKELAMTRRIALVIVAAAGICCGTLPAAAEEVGVGVGVGPVGAGVTVGSGPRERVRERDKVIIEKREPRDKTVIIKKDRDHRDRDHGTVVIDRD
jgi:hypothetical protein